MLIEEEIQRLFTGHSPQVSAAGGKSSELGGSRGLNSSLNRVVIRLPIEVTAMRSEILKSLNAASCVQIPDMAAEMNVVRHESRPNR